MRSDISWTERQADGVKRETRVRISKTAVKWQFKRTDQERWDYDSPPDDADWDMLEDILRRRAHRGRTVAMLDMVRRLRDKQK